MTQVTISLPDDLARQAQAAGLLGEQQISALLRRALGGKAAAQRLDRLLARLDALPEPPPTEQEIAEEIALARREHAHRR